MAVWLFLLAVIFTVEYAVMLVLPRLLPDASDASLNPPSMRWFLPLCSPRCCGGPSSARCGGDSPPPASWPTCLHRSRVTAGRRRVSCTTALASVDVVGFGPAFGQELPGQREVVPAGSMASSRLAENALTEVRRLALGLRPSLLDDLGLAPALERLVEDVTVHHPVAISLDVADVTGLRLPDAVASAVFRIVQETLANVVKHSGLPRHPSPSACARLRQRAAWRCGTTVAGSTPQRGVTRPPDIWGYGGCASGPPCWGAGFPLLRPPDAARVSP